jgi:hypothetical protein
MRSITTTLLLLPALVASVVAKIGYGVNKVGHNVAWIDGEYQCGTYVYINNGGNPCGTKFTLSNSFTYSVSYPGELNSQV